MRRLGRLTRAAMSSECDRSRNRTGSTRLAEIEALAFSLRELRQRIVARSTFCEPPPKWNAWQNTVVPEDQM